MNLAKRLWTYQAERFPLVRTVPLLAVFSAAAINVSAVLAGRDLPGLWAYVTGFVLAMAIFFQMRVADEHKDYEDDFRYRPERAVPRGLVSLRELAVLAALAGLVAIGVALTHPPALALTLLAVWAWLVLMTREFFVPDWLKARPILYLLSHMAIMPLIDLMLTGVEWAGYRGAPAGLWSFLALSFVNGCVLEIGRKTWAPESEREGVETYSRLWGAERSAQVWLAFVALAAVLLAAVGRATGAPLTIGLVAAAGFAVCAIVAVRFRARPDAAREKHVDAAAGLWVLICYAAAGFLPLFAGAAP